MTIIKHRANFAELIAQAAKQKKANASKEDDVYQLVQSINRQAVARASFAVEENSEVDESERSEHINKSERSSILKTGISSLAALQSSTHKARANGFEMSYFAYKLIESVPFRITRLLIIFLAFLLLGCDTDNTLRDKPAKIALDNVVDVCLFYCDWCYKVHIASFSKQYGCACSRKNVHYGYAQEQRDLEHFHFHLQFSICVVSNYWWVVSIAQNFCFNHGGNEPVSSD
jgi:hypothetical protein